MTLFACRLHDRCHLPLSMRDWTGNSLIANAFYKFCMAERPELHPGLWDPNQYMLESHYFAVLEFRWAHRKQVQTQEDCIVMPPARSERGPVLARDIEQDEENRSTHMHDLKSMAAHACNRLTSVDSAEFRIFSEGARIHRAPGQE